MNILVATDFSKPADHAIQLAAALAKRLGDRLVVAFVQDNSFPSFGDFGAGAEALERTLADSVAAQLQTMANELKTKGISAETRLLRGPVADSLAALGNELDARFIVAGTHARGAMGRLLLGSIIERLVLQSERPVLVSRVDGDEGLLTWARSDRPLNVAVALDCSSASRLGVEWVKTLRAAIPCNVTFINFYWPPEQMSRLGLSTEDALAEADPFTVESITRELREFVGELPGAGRVEFKVQSNWGEMGSRLAFAATDVGADVLVMGTHQRKVVKRLIMGATLQPTLHSATIPVLAVPGQAVAPARVLIPSLAQVLVATDFSDMGNAAVPYAYSVVESGGVVHLLHVIERHVPIFSFESPTAPAAEISGQIAFEDALAALVPQGAEQRGIRTKLHVVDGLNVGTTILQTAERIAVNAVCVGSHGRSNLRRVLLGGVASRVLEGARKPVFVVRGVRT